MPPDNYNFYDFLVDIVIPIGTFMVGLFVERKWNVVGKIFQIHDESKTKQSQDAIGDNNQYFQAKEIHGNVTMVSGAEGAAPESLPYRESQFVATIVNVLKHKDISSTFSDRYRDGYKHIKNSCSLLAASSYLSAFLQIKEIFLTDENYREKKRSGPLIEVLNNNFNTLQEFSDNHTNDEKKLKKMIDGIENTLISLLGYFIE